MTGLQLLLTATAAGLTLLIATDLAVGAWFPREVGPRLIHTIPSQTVNRMIVVFPGLGMPARHISEAFRPYLDPTDAMIVVQYARRVMDVDELVRQLTLEIDRHRPAQLRVYGASMGGMCATAFTGRLRPARPPAEIVLLLDTSPSHLRDVAVPRIVSSLTWYRGGPVSSLVWRLLCRFHRYPPTEVNADLGLVREAHRTFGATSMPTLVSQAAFVKDFALPTAGGAVDRVVFIRGLPAGGDPLIVLDSAIVGWRTQFPHLRVKVCVERRDDWHVPIIERPQETMRLIAGA